MAGFRVQIIRHAALQRVHGVGKIVQMAVSLIHHIQPAGHAVDADDQKNIYHHHEQIRKDINAADFYLQGEISYFIHRFPAPLPSDTRPHCLW